MLCPNCAKLSYTYLNKSCIRCQGQVSINIGILCASCSATEKKCEVCAKTIISEAQRQARRGCNCGSK